MKTIKILGLLVLGLVALILVIGAFQPTRVEFQRSTDIHASKEIVFAKVNDLTSYEEWGPWKEEDPTIKTTYGKITQGLGASYSWTSEESGSGTMTIVESTPPTWQKTALDFGGEGGGEGWFNLEDGENRTTKVAWGMGFNVPYPFNAFTLFTKSSMEKEVNDMFDLGLANLKAMCEKEAAVKTYRGYAITLMDFPGKSYLGLKGTVKFSDLPAFYSQSYGAIMGVVKAQKLEMDGMPCGLYYNWDEESSSTDMAAIIPIKGNVPVATGDIQPVEIPKGKCAEIDFYGNYEGLGEAHNAMDDYFKEKGLEPPKYVMEEYVTDPTTQPDTSKWLTKIYYFIESPLASEQ